MPRKRKQKSVTGLASEYFVASQLARLGYLVEVTREHFPGIDLFVAHPDGRTVTIDVKGVKDKSNWPVQPATVQSDFYVFVTYAGKFHKLDEQPPAVFVVPSAAVEKLVKQWKAMPGVPHHPAKQAQWSFAFVYSCSSSIDKKSFLILRPLPRNGKDVDVLIGPYPSLPTLPG